MNEQNYRVETERGDMTGRCTMEVAEELQSVYADLGIEADITPSIRGAPQ